MPSVTAIRTSLDETSWIFYIKNAVCPRLREEDELLAIMHEIPRRTTTMYGKSYEVPRREQLFGSKSYRYSGRLYKNHALVPALVARCIEHAKEHYPEFEWHGALVNLYENGRDSVSAHSDDESGLAPGAPILSFSFGAARKFTIRAKDKTVPRMMPIHMTLSDRDLVVMGGDMQKRFTHEVPKLPESAPEVGWRLNVTVRSFATGGDKPASKRARASAE